MNHDIDIIAACIDFILMQLMVLVQAYYNNTSDSIYWMHTTSYDPNKVVLTVDPIYSSSKI